jgi:phosphatidylglycerol:prolipoprotein diacylglycerol transferase
MHQVLVNIRGLALHTYGVLIAVGFLLGIVLAAREAKRGGIEQARMLDLCFWILVFGLLGARVLYILTNLGDYATSCRDGIATGGLRNILWSCSSVFHVWEGGIVFYGGFIGATLAVLFYTWRHHMPFLRTADALAPSLALGHFFGRLGCWSAGCCFGKICHWSFGARFPRGSLAFEDLAARGLVELGQARTPPLHPTQLYEALGELVIFIVLALVLKRRKRFDGQILLGYLMLYPILRSVIEIFRGDAARKYVVEVATPRLNAWLGLPPGEPSLLSTSQFVSIGVAAVALVLWLILRARRRAGAIMVA